MIHRAKVKSLSQVAAVATCSCGYLGPTRHDRHTAGRDADEHLLALRREVSAQEPTRIPEDVVIMLRAEWRGLIPQQRETQARLERHRLPFAARWWRDATQTERNAAWVLAFPDKEGE